MREKNERLDFENSILKFPILSENAQRSAKGGGMWVNGVYITDDMLDFADSYALNADPINWGGDQSNGGGDYGDADYGGGSSGGSGTYYHADQTIHTVMSALSGTTSIGSIAADISTIVDNLNATELNKIKAFGKKIGVAGIAITAVDMAYGVWEEGAFDANDALTTAGIVLGGVALVVSAPIAVTLGTASLIVGIWASTGAGEDIDLIGGGDYGYGG